MINITKGHVWKHKNLFENYAMVTQVEFNFMRLTHIISFDKVYDSKIYRDQKMTKSEFLDEYFLLK